MDSLKLASAYRLISELFLYPEDRDTAKIEAELANLADCPPELRTPLDTFLTTPSAMSTQEYVATLELSPPVPLYFGAHLYDEPKTCRGAGLSGRNGYMLELGNIYRHFGVEFAGRELVDFVPVVVEFLGISLERSDADQIGLRRYFIETLLINGVETLWSALRKHESPYALLIEALRVALTEDIARMAGGPKWVPSTDVDGQEIPASDRAATAIDHTVYENGVEL